MDVKRSFEKISLFCNDRGASWAGIIAVSSFILGNIIVSSSSAVSLAVPKLKSGVGIALLLRKTLRNKGIFPKRLCPEPWTSGCVVGGVGEVSGEVGSDSFIHLILAYYCKISNTIIIDIVWF